MKVVTFLKRLFIVWAVGTATVPISYLGFGVGIGDSILLSFGTAALTAIFFVFKSARIAYKDPYREELAYIKHQAREARKQLKVISSSRFKLKSIHMWTELSKLYRVGKSIVDMVEKEPARYKSVQPFFTNYLQATVTVIERYVFLLSKPTKSIDVKESIHEAENVIHELSTQYDQLLNSALSQDVLSLDVEMKVLKQHFQNEEEYAPINRMK
ncbi:5-bromo-4-chloroindolyl phosphate hydrolysis family protein [Priestia flexa]|uniref:5-bromo-4-chloroindolyl phosphate hydrolysis family protein n=1 Tax=Priestia flexa TaxID=86664 RepID=UPI00099E075D|nr:5-bromo-4-chloroindolyl phosphate hydrolysis family protein [Priestia flexa]AQX55143.1 phosphatase [Priestia flexa]WEZ07442.1 5-bromo-4-chloroindolyl phosphate hydrolysis family protein [Priestia flexa]